MEGIKKTLIILFVFMYTFANAQEIQPEAVKKDMKRVADWQIFHFRNPSNYNNKAHHPLDWTNGALYVGMVKWAAIADDSVYYNWLYNIGKEYEWKLHERFSKYHADDHTVGQLYCELYRVFGDESMLEPTIRQFNYIMLHPAQTELNWDSPYHYDRWNWCDALFMSPPVWAKLYNITGEQKYLDFMIKEYKATTDFLFDKEENLYYRDENFINKLDNGVKIFWSRGNGWVFAGLANIMAELDPKSKEFKYFAGIFKKMAGKLKEIQTPQGHWAMSLLGADFYPTPETSGSSFFTFGLAWGINNGLLDYDAYEPVVKKAWNAMVSHIQEDGMLGYVQPIGGGPGKAWPDQSEVYGTGAFLSAGAEVHKLYTQ